MWQGTLRLVPMGPVQIRDIPPFGVMLNAMRIMLSQIKGLHYVKRAMRYVK